MNSAFLKARRNKDNIREAVKFFAEFAFGVHFSGDKTVEHIRNAAVNVKYNKNNAAARQKKQAQRRSNTAERDYICSLLHLKHLSFLLILSFGKEIVNKISAALDNADNVYYNINCGNAAICSDGFFHGKDYFLLTPKFY